MPGLAYPFMREKLKGKSDAEFLAVEPKAVPSTTRGEYRYDFGDTGEMTPLFKMYTVGHTFQTPAHPRGRAPLSRQGTVDVHADKQGIHEERRLLAERGHGRGRHLRSDGGHSRRAGDEPRCQGGD